MSLIVKYEYLCCFIKQGDLKLWLQYAQYCEKVVSIVSCLICIIDEEMTNVGLGQFAPAQSSVWPGTLLSFS